MSMGTVDRSIQEAKLTVLSITPVEFILERNVTTDGSSLERRAESENRKLTTREKRCGGE